MYRLAYDSKPRQVRDLLKFPRRKENAPRKDFVDDTPYGKLMGKAKELWLRGLLATAYTFGFRSSELVELRVEQINLTDRSICLDPGETKNDDARTIRMTQEVYNLVAACISGKKKDDCVFTQGGEPVEDFRGAWWALCAKAGLGKFVKAENDRLRWKGLLFHDLRRSAVPDMVRAGIPDVVSMKISGHRNRSVFDRYNIVSKSDLVDAASKLEKRTDPTTDPRQAA
jgi:integrase